MSGSCFKTKNIGETKWDMRLMKIHDVPINI